MGAGGFRGRGRDPNDFINAEGELPNDRTHMFRVQATVDVPKIDVMIGANFQYLSGTPWAATAVVGLPQGFRSIFIEPRGSRRLPSQSLLDLRLSKTFRFSRDGRVELLVDIFNALNATTTERVRSTNFFSPTFEEGRAYITPRRAMLGVKLTF